MIDVKAAVKEAFDSVEATRLAIRDALDGPLPPGLKPIDDAAFMQFVMGMTKQFPPEPAITPDGRTVVESPWILMLPFVDGGKQILDRIIRIREKGLL